MNDFDIDLFEGLFEDEPKKEAAPKAAASKPQVTTPAPKQTKAKPKKTAEPNKTNGTNKTKTPKTETKPKAQKVDTMALAIEAYFEQQCQIDPEFAAKYRSGSKTVKDACQYLNEYHKKDAVNGCFHSSDDADNLLAKKFIMDDKKQIKGKSATSATGSKPTKMESKIAEMLPDDEEDDVDETAYERTDDNDDDNDNKEDGGLIDIFDNI